MGRRINISNKAIVVIAIFLVAIFAVSGWMYSKQISDIKEGLTVYLGDEKIAEYSFEDVIKLESTTEYKQILSASSRNEKGNYTGVMADEILEISNVDQKLKSVLFISADGYTSAVDTKELKRVLIAYEKDGEPLGHFNDGGSGPLRCIMLDDEFGTRGIKNIVKIKCIEDENT